MRESGTELHPRYLDVPRCRGWNFRLNFSHPSSANKIKFFQITFFQYQRIPKATPCFAHSFHSGSMKFISPLKPNQPGIIKSYISQTLHHKLSYHPPVISQWSTKFLGYPVSHYAPKLTQPCHQSVPGTDQSLLYLGTIPIFSIINWII